MALIPYAELAGSPTERNESSNLAATMRVKVDWADRYQAQSELLGSNYPHRTDVPMFCQNVNIDPLPAQALPDGVIPNSQLTSYEFAVLTLTFRSANPNDAIEINGRFITETLEPTAEFMTLPHEDFAWGSTTGTELTEREAPGRLMVGMDYILSVHQAVSVPMATLTLPGHVNDGVVVAETLGRLAFPQETLLYNSPTVVKTTDIDGNATLQLTYRFTYRPNGWNSWWRTKSKSYERIFHKETGEYFNFPLGNFLEL